MKTSERQEHTPEHTAYMFVCFYHNVTFKLHCVCVCLGYKEQRRLPCVDSVLSGHVFILTALSRLV